MEHLAFKKRSVAWMNLRGASIGFLSMSMVKLSSPYKMILSKTSLPQLLSSYTIFDLIFDEPYDGMPTSAPVPVFQSRAPRNSFTTKHAVVYFNSRSSTDLTVSTIVGLVTETTISPIFGLQMRE